MSHHFRAMFITLALSMTWLMGCQKQSKASDPVEPVKESQVKRSFGGFLPLQSEVLVRDRTASLIKFVKYQEAFVNQWRDAIEVSMGLFLKDSGEAFVFVSWTFPEYLESGGRIWRSSDDVYKRNWEINGEGLLVVGDRDIVISENSIEFEGYVSYAQFDLPKQWKNLITPLQSQEAAERQPKELEIVSEVLEAEVVDAIF